MRRLFASLLVLISLVGCTSDEKASGTSIVCAFVEGYFDTKTLIMIRPPSEAVDMAQGMTPSPQEISTSFVLDSEAKAIQIRLRAAMVDWAKSLQNYSQTQDKDDFALAGQVLKKEIDDLAIQCTNQGWRFPSNWIHNDL